MRLNTRHMHSFGKVGTNLGVGAEQVLHPNSSAAFFAVRGSVAILVSRCAALSSGVLHED